MDDRPSILIVDDDPRNLLALDAVLSDLGCDLTKVTSGRDALRLLLSRSFALILLDVRIPDMSGFEIAELMRSHPRWQRTPIIFLTAYEGDQETVFQGYARGGVDYIIKPFDPRLLRAKVQVFVELHLKTEQVRLETERRIRAEEREEQERKTAAVMAQAAQELARSNAELEQFAVVASHDLQEPLRMITSYAGLLLKEHEEKLDDRGRLYLGFMRDGAMRMKKMVDSLLYYARIGQHGRPFERIDCGALVDEVLGSMKVTLEEIRAQISVDPMPEVSGDRLEVTRVFQNLLSNALKFRSERPPEVRVSAERLGEDWRFAIADNGLGIDEKHFERVFGMFQRLHPADRYQGTGIGLSECKKIVERHGGRIWVESKPGNGTTFYFTIRAAE